MNKMKTQEYSQYFETAKRINGDEFIRLTENVPKSLRNLIYNIHLHSFGGCLPNDWIYKIILEAFEELEIDSLEDINIEADPYNNDLANWLLNPFSSEYCQEAQEEGFVSDKSTIYERIGYGQELAKQRIYDTVNNFLKAGE